jgi:predicted transcriptional regulator
MIKNILGCLTDGNGKTPSSISKCVNANPKTIQKYVRTAENLGILQCEEITMGKNQIKICKINPKYKQIMNDMGSD